MTFIALLLGWVSLMVAISNHERDRAETCTYWLLVSVICLFFAVFRMATSASF